MRHLTKCHQFRFSFCHLLVCREYCLTMAPGAQPDPASLGVRADPAPACSEAAPWVSVSVSLCSHCSTMPSAHFTCSTCYLHSRPYNVMYRKLPGKTIFPFSFLRKQSTSYSSLISTFLSLSATSISSACSTALSRGWKWMNGAATSDTHTSELLHSGQPYVQETQTQARLCRPLVFHVNW